MKEITTAWLTARPTPGGASGRSHPLVAADDGDDRAEQGALDHRAPEVGDRGVGEERREEAAERLVVEQLGEDAAADAEDQRVDVEQAGDQHQRQEARHDQVLDRVDAEHLQGVELLADLAGAEVGGDRGAGDAGDDDGGDEGRELADRGEDEEAAEPVERAEEGEEVGRLQARGAEAEGHGRDQQREPAELQGEEELADELLAVGVGRLDRGDHRASGEDHHVPDLLEERLGGQRMLLPIDAAASISPPAERDRIGRPLLRALSLWDAPAASVSRLLRSG